MTVLLDVTIGIELEPTPTVGLDMVTICSEGGLETDEPGEESIWGLKGYELDFDREG